MPPATLPERLDRLPWSGWHWRVVVALGVAWVLDGLEVTLVGSVGGVLERPDTLGLTAGQVGWAGSVYVAGAVLGALAFGRMADRLGRKRLFLVTLLVYMAATVATAFCTGFTGFALCRFVTGIGIGGEYAAINSAIDELIPARVRGRVNLAINGSFWLGAALGAVLSLVLLDARVLGPQDGWRAGFLVGAVLSVAILLVRRHVPESPRWLLAHGRAEEAERVMAGIEAAAGVRTEPAPAGLRDGPARALPTWREVVEVLAHRYRQRSLVVLALMVSQAFFYNAIFFTYALVLTRFHGVDHHWPVSTRIATSQSSKISSLAMRTRTPSTPGSCISRCASLPISACQQVHVLRGALVDDDLAHLAVVQHVRDVVVARQQRLRAEVQLGVDRIGCGAVFSWSRMPRLASKRRPSRVRIWVPALAMVGRGQSTFANRG
jgi:MFS family permease